MKAPISCMPLALLAALLLGACARPPPGTVEATIEATFRELREIRMMKPGQDYAVTVAGQPEHGPKERFLRRRTAAEIWASGLSTGCGDYALAFIERLSAEGVPTLLIDAAELSPRSLETRFAGHAVVAVWIAGEPGAWWLVDPTARNILERPWDPAAPTFEARGKRFWIGFRGPVEDYPVDGPESLRAFYDRTLQALPEDVREAITGDAAR